MSRLLFLTLGIAMLVGFSSIGQAAPDAEVYYVAPPPLGEDGNPGTLSAPWATLQYAADQVSAGDEVIVFDGNYAGFRLATSGTVSDPIYFHAQGSEVVIDIAGPTDDGIRLQNISYVIIEGFRIEDMPEFGIAHRGATPDEPVHGLVIRGNTVISSGNVGMYLSEVADSLIEDNTILQSNNHGIYLANAGSDSTTLRSNHISGNLTAGIHFNGDLSIGGDGIISGLLIENNILHDNGQNGLNMDGVQDSLIQNNLIYGNASNGIRAYRIDAAQGPRGLRIINNTIHVPADGYWCLRITEDLGDILAFNNILMNDYAYGGSIALDHTAGFASAHNAVVDRFTPDRSDTILTLQQWQQLGYDEGSFLTQPAALFVDPGTADYRLKTGSPAVDVGLSGFVGYSAPSEDLSGAARPVGVAVDLGAYELVPDLELRGIPSNETIQLSWSVNLTLPLTSTWQIDYAGPAGTEPSPITGIPNEARSYSLTGLTNYEWYTLTLSAMVNETAVLSDTISLLPTDLFIYLPLARR